MAWGIHPPNYCHLGLSRKDAQRAPQPMTAAAAAATISSPSFAVFLSKLFDNQLWLRAACALGMFAAHMAMPFNHDTGQLHHYLHSTLNHHSPLLPPILHANANLSSSSPHPCKGLPPASKHPWLSIPRESASQALEENQVQSKVRMRMSNYAHASWPTYIWPLLWKLFQAGCCGEHSLRKWLKWIHQAGSSARHKATCLAFQAEDQGLKSVSTRTPSPPALTTMPHHAWQTTSTCLRIPVLTKLNNKFGRSMMDW
jgi:hypothetical protein